jgi:hypothetical protein
MSDTHERMREYLPKLNSLLQLVAKEGQAFQDKELFAQCAVLAALDVGSLDGSIDEFAKAFSVFNQQPPLEPKIQQNWLEYYIRDRQPANAQRDQNAEKARKNAQK